MKYYIYHIKSLRDSRFYIGSTINAKKRWNEHKCRLRLNKHDNHQIQRFYNKYGIDALEFVVIAECADQSEMIDCEQWMLNHNYGTADCWNENPTADRPPTMFGKKHTDETKVKISKAKLGKLKSLETRIKLSQAKSGEKNHNAKLSYLQVKIIRKLLKFKTLTYQKIGTIFNVSKETIYDIRAKRTWK